MPESETYVDIWYVGTNSHIRHCGKSEKSSGGKYCGEVGGYNVEGLGELVFMLISRWM